MADIVFKPKYKATFWVAFALLLVLAAAVLGAALIIVLDALKRQLVPEEITMTVSFFVMFILILLCALNLVTKSIVIGSGGMSAATLLGNVRKRPFAPKAYYEQGCFIINGFVISNMFFKNTGELDSALKKLSAAGKIKYVREKGVLDSQPAGNTMVMFISACILGIFFSVSLGMLQPWDYVMVIDLAFAVWLVFTFNKLPRVNKSIAKQLSVYFE